MAPRNSPGWKLNLAEGGELDPAFGLAPDLIGLSAVCQHRTLLDAASRSVSLLMRGRLAHLGAEEVDFEGQAAEAVEQLFLLFQVARLDQGQRGIQDPDGFVVIGRAHGLQYVRPRHALLKPPALPSAAIE